jgi:hypothetical protein
MDSWKLSRSDFQTTASSRLPVLVVVADGPLREDPDEVLMREPLEVLALGL